MPYWVLTKIGGSALSCENCVYYDTERTEQPCCSCVDWCNFESEVNTK